jgi:uncharacterized protein YbcI
MTAQPGPERPAGRSLQVALSNAIVGLLREYTGRGPMKARTSIRDNVALVMLEQTLTKGEQGLVRRAASNRCSRCVTSTRKRCARKAASMWLSSPGEPWSRS